MNSADTSSPPTQPAIRLDYGRADGTGGVARNVSADLHERVDGVATFFGMVAAAFGGWRQLTWSVGLALIGGGLGSALERPGDVAHFWLAAGAFLVGCAVPVPGRGTAAGGADRVDGAVSPTKRKGV
jgi:hypothetical protein